MFYYQGNPDWTKSCVTLVIAIHDLINPQATPQNAAPGNVPKVVGKGNQHGANGPTHEGSTIEDPAAMRELKSQPLNPPEPDQAIWLYIFVRQNIHPGATKDPTKYTQTNQT